MQSLSQDLLFEPFINAVFIQT